jgi:hypothetical protein
MGAEMSKVPVFRLDCVALGPVADGEDLSHILFREEFREVAAEADEVATEGTEHVPLEEQVLARDLARREHPRVVICRRQPDGEWRMLAGHRFPGINGLGVSIAIDVAVVEGVADPYRG